MKTIIGITGVKNSGKDEVARMVNNLLINKKMNFNSYLDATEGKHRNLYSNKRIIAFGDKLKDVCSKMFSIPRRYFDSRTHKDEMYYSYNDNTFVKEVPNNSVTVTIDMLDRYYLSDILKDDLPVYIKLRTIMQYVGSDISRGFIDSNIWIRNIKLEVLKLFKTVDEVIISDFRIEDEVNYFRGMISKDVNFVLIKVDRESAKINIDDHESETGDFITDYVIDNNGDLENLFNGVVTVLTDLKLINN